MYREKLFPDPENKMTSGILFGLVLTLVKNIDVCT